MRMRIPAIVAAALALAPAGAQEPAVKVYYTSAARGWNSRQVDDAIGLALNRPEFSRQARPDPATLVITTPERVHWEVGDRRAFSFTIAFTRDGDPVGQSDENCFEAKMADCADQIAADVKSAAAIGH